MSVKYCLRVPVFHFRSKVCTRQRGLSAVAEHLVYIYIFHSSWYKTDSGVNTLTEAVATSEPCWLTASAAMSFWCAVIVTGAVDWHDSVNDRSYTVHTHTPTHSTLSADNQHYRWHHSAKSKQLKNTCSYTVRSMHDTSSNCAEIVHWQNNIKMTTSACTLLLSKKFQDLPRTFEDPQNISTTLVVAWQCLNIEKQQLPILCIQHDSTIHAKRSS